MWLTISASTIPFFVLTSNSFAVVMPVFKQSTSVTDVTGDLDNLSKASVSICLSLGDKTLEGVRKQADAQEGVAKTSFIARLLFGNKGLNLFGDDGLLNLGGY